MDRTSEKTGLILALLFALAASTSDAVPISGVITDAANGAPIAGALVSLQASAHRTTTAADGTYALDVPLGTGLTIVAAAKAYFNESTTVDPPAAGVNISLTPVPQDDDPGYPFFDPEDCAACHWNQYDQWLGTPMANAGLNTWVADIYNGTGTPGGMGGFVYVRDSVFADTNPASECASCHQPERWIADPFTPQEDPQDPPSPAVAHGISCEVCHKVADVDVSKINFPGIFPGAVTFTRPAGPQWLQVQYGVLGDADFQFPPMMRPSYQPQLVAEVCGTCHQDKNDPDENHTYTGVTSEPTYIEWVESPYGDPASPFYATCVDCHMPPSGQTEVCDILFPPLIRDPSTIRSHTILGTTPAFLENAVELTMQASLAGNEIDVNVTVTNSNTGHHVPTGVTVRNMILLVEAWRDGDDPLTGALPFTGTQAVHELGGVGDPAEGYFAGRPGKFFSKVNHNAEGNGPTFFTDATGIQFDNRIPPLQADTTHYTFQAPPEGGTVHVRARLIYRRAFRFLVDAKQWTQDGHGEPLADVLPPHFGHLMETAEQTLSVPETGACCFADGACAVVTMAECTQTPGSSWAGAATTCADDDADGLPDVCQPPPTVPATSSWGLLVLALALLTASKLIARCRMLSRTAF